MKAIIVTVTLWAGLTAPAFALTKEQCAALASTVTRAATSMTALLAATKATDLSVYANDTNPDLQKAFQAAIKAQASYVTGAQAYATALQDAAYQLQVCARG